MTGTPPGFQPAPIPNKATISEVGLGTRFLPETRAMPKKMLPVVDHPAIHNVVEEDEAAGLSDVLVITGRHLRSLENDVVRQPTAITYASPSCRRRLGVVVRGRRYDTGDRPDFINSEIRLSCERPDLGPDRQRCVSLNLSAGAPLETER